MSFRPGKFAPLLIREKTINEHLDNFICCATDRVDWRLQRVPCCGRANSLVARIRGDIPHSAFCDGKKGSLEIQGVRQRV